MVPDPANLILPEFKLFNSVQLVPFHISVSTTFGSPPKASDAVAVPHAAKNSLAVFKSFPSAQAEPFQVSV